MLFTSLCPVMYDDQTSCAINHIHNFLATNEYYQQKVIILHISSLFISSSSHNIVVRYNISNYYTFG
jgi:hypothetical protein